MKINPAVNAIANQATPLNSQAPKSGDDFGQMLMDAIKDVDAEQKKSLSMQNDLMAGRPVEPHELMIAMERASLALNLTMQVRNKLLEAYQDVSRMNV